VRLDDNCAGTEPNCYCAGSPLTSKYLQGGGDSPHKEGSNHYLEANPPTAFSRFSRAAVSVIISRVNASSGCCARTFARRFVEKTRKLGFVRKSYYRSWILVLYLNRMNQSGIESIVTIFN
jgi:hypothetical protein